MKTQKQQKLTELLLLKRLRVISYILFTFAFVFLVFAFFPLDYLPDDSLNPYEHFNFFLLSLLFAFLALLCSFFCSKRSRSLRTKK